MYTATISPKETENRKRSIRISIFIHALLLLLLLIPIITPKPLAPEEFQRAIMIKFEDNGSTMSGSSGSSSSMEEAAAAGAEEASSPRDRMEVSELQPTPQQQTPTFAVPERQQFITAPNPDVVINTNDNAVSQPIEFKEIQDAPEEFEDIPPLKSFVPEEKVVFHAVEAQSSDLASESAEGLFDSPMKGTGAGKNNGSGATAEGTGSGAGGTGNTNGGSGQGTGTGQGAAGSGSGTGSGGNAGNDTGRGNMGKAMWGDYAGEGLFNRKVLKRANVASIAKVNGKLYFKICLDRSGKVVYAEVDPANSTIKDRQIQAQAEKLATQMQWNSDPTAPKIQCGWYTLIYKVDQ